MHRTTIPLILAGFCAFGARAEAGIKCPLDGHETVIMDNNYALPAVQWGAVGGPGGGPGGQNEPWSLIGYQAVRAGGAFGYGAWTVGATGDLDGDGDCDLVWENQALVSDHLLLTVTLTDGTFSAPSANPVALDLAGPWKLVGSGHFLDVNGNPDVPGAPRQADVVLWNPADKTIGFLLDAQHLSGARFFTGPSTPEIQGLAVADVQLGGMPELIWRSGLEPALSYWSFRRNGTTIEKDGEGTLQFPVDFNWWLRGAGDFDGDGFDDLLFQNLPNSEKTVIWLMAGVTRREGAFTDPNLLMIDPTAAPLTGFPRVIVAPR